MFNLYSQLVDITGSYINKFLLITISINFKTCTQNLPTPIEKKIMKIFLQQPSSRCNVELEDEEKGIKYRKITNLNRKINCNLVSDNEE